MENFFPLVSIIIVHINLLSIKGKSRKRFGYSFHLTISSRLHSFLFECVEYKLKIAIMLWSLGRMWKVELYSRMCVLRMKSFFFLLCCALETFFPLFSDLRRKIDAERWHESQRIFRTRMNWKIISLYRESVSEVESRTIN